MSDRPKIFVKPNGSIRVTGAADFVDADGNVIEKLARVQRQMLQDLGREPTPEELAKELDMTPEKVVEVQKYGREPISLHTPLGEEGDSEDRKSTRLNSSHRL